MRVMSRSEFVELQQRLLQLEQRAEEDRVAQLSEDGMCELQLLVDRLDEQEDDVCDMVLRHESFKRLPKHCIELGSQVAVLSSPKKDDSTATLVQNVASANAVVTKVMPDSLTLTLSFESKFYKGQSVSVILQEYSNHDQLKDAMTWLKNIDTSSSDHPAAPVVQEMFKEGSRGRALGTFYQFGSSMTPLNRNLDASQWRAVELAVRDQPLSVLHGPPGTGKTTTIVEVILQHVKRGERVLVCAPSNKAVDNLLEGVWKQARKQPGVGLGTTEITRLGHVARMSEKHRRFSHTLKLRKRLGRPKSARTSKADYQRREAELSRLLSETLVLLSTLSSVQSVNLKYTFDLLVIDECGQATEAACWLAIPLARRVLLAGDPCQLPPTVLSQEAARRGLAKSLMERQMELHEDAGDVVHMLDTQYRMHELIQAWSSENLYGGKLKAAPAVARRLLTDLPSVRSTPHTQTTLLLMDTAGRGLRECPAGNSGSSRSNQGEADLVVRHARSLVQAGLPAEDIGVITPYKQQVRLISNKLRDVKLNVEVNSVDGYQGREKEAILLSLVRSNGRRQVGFVSDQRRLNVAVTRARRHLFVVCDSATVGRNKTIRSLLDHLDGSGQARSTYHTRRPGDEQGRRASGMPPAPLLSTATAKPGLQALTDSLRQVNISATKDAEAVSVTGLTRNMEAMSLRHRSTDVIRNTAFNAYSSMNVTVPAVRPAVAERYATPVARGQTSQTNPVQVKPTVGSAVSRPAVRPAVAERYAVPGTAGRRTHADFVSAFRASDHRYSIREQRASDLPVGSAADLPWWCTIL